MSRTMRKVEGIKTAIVFGEVQPHKVLFGILPRYKSEGPIDNRTWFKRKKNKRIRKQSLKDLSLRLRDWQDDDIAFWSRPYMDLGFSSDHAEWPDWEDDMLYEDEFPFDVSSYSYDEPDDVTDPYYDPFYYEGWAYDEKTDYDRGYEKGYADAMKAFYVY